jgi:hypothetical protein
MRFVRAGAQRLSPAGLDKPELDLCFGPIRSPRAHILGPHGCEFFGLQPL